MKKILSFLFVSASLAMATVHIVVPIPPIAFLVDKIGDPYVQTVTMIQPGQSPHTYEPKPSQMKQLAQAELYTAIGIEFDKRWLATFKQTNPSLHILRLDEGIEKLPMLPSDSEHTHGSMEHRHDDAYDPHIWTSPWNMLHMARLLRDALIRYDRRHAPRYRRNFETFQKEVLALDKTIKQTLSAVPPKTPFLTFHPSWGYFAHTYNLRQIPVEVEGKNPTPRRLIAVIRLAKQTRASLILTQPEFSDKSAQIIARQAGIKVLKLSPLSYRWGETLLKLAEAIAEGNKR